MEDAVRIPLLDSVLPGGLRFGANYLVEFEPQSLWFEASLTLCAQALRMGIRTDYHVFTHLPEEIRTKLTRLGLDVPKLESDETFRIVDSYSVQTGKGPAKRVGKTTTLDWVDLKSMSMNDWNFSTSSILKTDVPEVDKRRFHIDDNTSVLVQFNDEKSVAEHFRTHTVPFARHLQLAAIHSVATGIFSDSFYRQFEAFCDGIVDVRALEVGGRMSNSMRVRMVRGEKSDSAWKQLELRSSGEVVLAGRESGELQVLPERREADERPSGQFEGAPPGVAERRLAAIMFTDTVGFTGLGQKNEELMMRLLEDQRLLVRPIFSKYRGREVKSTGDGFLVEFSSAQEAVRCALEIQTALRNENMKRTEVRAIKIRIGIHLGDVIHEGNDVAGDAVNVASRIEPLAMPGGVCVTRQVYESVVNKVQAEFVSLGSPSLKNVSSPVEVYQIVGLGTKATGAEAFVPPQRDRIAVLPFANISSDKSDEFFSDGMTEEMIASISRTPGLRVIARTSVMKYKGKEKPISDVGKELGVGSVLEGSVRRSGDKLRITVKLVDTRSEEPRWSQTYDRELSDVFVIQSDIASQVAGVLKAQVLGPSQEISKPPSSFEAYVEYLRGRQAWNRRNEEGLRQSIQLFEKALGADRSYAKAYSGLADSFATLALLELAPPNEVYPNARNAVGQALTLDPQLVEAHTSLGLIRFQYDWDWKGAEEEFREAIKINPSYAPAHHFFADYLKAMGRFEEALAEIAKAQELDPLNLAINTGVGHVLYLSRQYDRAIEQYRKAVELDPTFMLTHIWFGRPYLEKGMYSEALSELETAVKLSGEGTLALAMLGHGLASAERKEEALKILEKLFERAKTRYVPSYWIAVIYNGFREKNQVVSWLRKAFDERSSWLVWCNVEPRFDWLRNDPEFIALMEAMKLG